MVLFSQNKSNDQFSNFATLILKNNMHKADHKNQSDSSVSVRECSRKWSEERSGNRMSTWMWTDLRAKRTGSQVETRNFTSHTDPKTLTQKGGMVLIFTLIVNSWMKQKVCENTYNNIELLYEIQSYLNLSLTHTRTK